MPQPALHELTLDDALQVGRKAAVLGELMAAGFQVPAGRVLPETWFASWDADALDVGALRQAVAEILDDLGDGLVAVRSSGVDEDGAGSSMAGCFDSTLGVQGVDDALQAVLDTFASARRARTTLGLDAGGMAVLIQRQVEANSAGVVFTADPITGERDVCCIEAVRGLGDALMAGEVDAERWRVRQQVLEDGGGGVLSADQALEIAAVARKIAAVLGGPMDVEWALEDGQLRILQSRPITALPAAPIPIDSPIPDGAWERDDHCPVPSPLTWQLWYEVYPRQMAEAFKTAGMPLETMEAACIHGQTYLRVVTGGPEGPPPPGPILWLFSRLAPSFRKAEREVGAFLADRTWIKNIDRWETEWEPALAARCRTLVEVDIAFLDDDALLGHLEGCRDLLRDAGAIHAQLGGSHSIPLAMLIERTEQWLGWSQARTNELLAGYSPGTTQVDRELAELAAPWADDPRLHQGTLADVRAAIPELDAALASWSRWGGLRRADYDVLSPTLGECDTLILSRMRASTDILERLPRLSKGARARAAELLAEARSALTDVQFAEFDQLVQESRAGAHNRDTNALVSFQLPSSLCRLGALEVGRRATKRGHLDAHDDAIFLRTEEWPAALDGSDPTVRDRVTRRRGERSWALANPGPTKLGTHHPEPDPSWFPPNLRALFQVVGHFNDPVHEGEGLIGTAAGGGVHEGTVRILRTADEISRLRPGDVMVCESTGCAWAPAYSVAGAIVTERGGLLSHPAILAREYGLPAALAIPGATQQLKDGQRVRVDGGTGRVEVL